MDLPIQIGKNLRELRVSRGFSQLELEKRTGLAAGTISRIEHGLVTPTIITLYKISNELALENDDKLRLVSI